MTADLSAPTATPTPTEDGPSAQLEEQRERYRELLEELRVILPGVEVLFAFLLTAPFSQRFNELDTLGLRMYGGALLGVGLAAVALLTPSAFHRIGKGNDRAERLRIGVVSVIAGVVLLTVSVPAVVFAVVRFAFDSTAWGLICALPTLLASLVLWYVLPLWRTS